MSRSAIGWRNGPHFHIYTASDSNQMQLGSSSFTIEPTIISWGTATSQATATVTNAINRTTLTCNDGGTGEDSLLLNVIGNKFTLHNLPSQLEVFRVNNIISQ